MAVYYWLIRVTPEQRIRSVSPEQGVAQAQAAIRAKVDKHQRVSLETDELYGLWINISIILQLKKKNKPKEKQGEVGLASEKNVEKDIGWWIGGFLY